MVSFSYVRFGFPVRVQFDSLKLRKESVQLTFSDYFVLVICFVRIRVVFPVLTTTPSESVPIIKPEHA